ncbi:MAG TPA: transketolase C-terminal domain-containing protein [Solirubrobacterales bacterium]
MHGGKLELPAVVRLPTGVVGGAGAEHSQSLEAMGMHVPGLKVALPATPADAKGLLKSASRDPNPVLFFEHKALYLRKGELDTDKEVPLGVAEVVREGTDATVVATQLMRERTLEAAEQLAGDGIELEVIDPRTLAPLDTETIVRSVEKTGNLLVVEEGPGSGGWGSTVLARLAEEAFEMFDSPPRLLSTDETPTPFATELEAAWLADVEAIVGAVRGLEVIA